MTDECLRAWVRFSKIEMGSGVACRLIDRFKSPQAVFQASDEQLAEFKTVASRIRIVDKMPIDKDLRIMDSMGLSLIPLTSPSYPKLLKNISDQPAFLYVKGDISCLNNPTVAIVGSRQNSFYGKKAVIDIASSLARNNVTVISGGAAGIDTAAHTGALAADGKTVVVLGCGVNVVYPSANSRLFEKISKSGALISEYSLSTPGISWHFAQRNRIVSGLSLGVLVCNAPLKSGALITAEYAKKQGKKLFAIPGNIDDPRNEGSNNLIKEGAIPVMSVDDILNALGYSAKKEKKREIALHENEQIVYNIITHEPITFDDIVASVEASCDVRSILIMLEMKGAIKRLPGNVYVRI